MEEAQTGTATYTGSVTKQEGLVDLVSDVNGYTEANFPTGQRPDGYDSDNDGMPDEWEIANGLNPNDASDASLYTIDTQKDGTPTLRFISTLSLKNIMKSQNTDAINTIDEYYPSCVSTGISNEVTTSEIKED